MDDKYHIIRGKRIDDQLDGYELYEQSTYSDLERNILNFTPVTTKRQHSVDPVRIVSIELLPFLGTKNLNVGAVASSDGTNYSPKMIFNNIDFDDEDQQDNVTFKAKDGNDYHLKPLDLNQHTVRVHCDCLDFYWRFAAFNAKDKSLIGAPPKPYKRVSNRGPANPQEKPGVCKHLIAAVKALKHSGIVK